MADLEFNEYDPLILLSKKKGKERKPIQKYA